VFKAALLSIDLVLRVLKFEILPLCVEFCWDISVHTYVGMELESKNGLESEWVLRDTNYFTWSNEAKTVIKLWHLDRSHL
jgi:hypothetical protein